MAGLTFSRRHGFSLMEVVMALGITTFCMTALLGLFSVGVTVGRESAEELKAAHFAQSFISTRRASPTANLGEDFPLPPLAVGMSVPVTTVKLDADGNVTTVPTEMRYGLKYRVDAPAPGLKKPFIVYLCLFWPAQASLDKGTGRYELTTFLPPP